MKRVVALLLLAVLLLAGCSSQKFTVDPDNGTISNGKYTYQYTDETTTGDKGVTRTIRIKYPNGGIYHWEKNIGEHSSQSYGRGNELYDPVAYARGEDLVEAVLKLDQEIKNEETKNKETNNEGNKDPYAIDLDLHLELILPGILLIVLGIWSVAKPHTFWYFGLGRWFKNAEPSDEGIGWITMTGYFDITFGLILLLVGIFVH